jgi:hypothetical protein
MNRRVEVTLIVGRGTDTNAARGPAK